MKRASLLAVILAVVAVLALGWWITRRDARPAAIVMAEPAQTTLAAESLELAGAEVADTTATREVAAAGSASRSGPNPAVVQRVSVVAAGTYTLVPDAEVRWTNTLPVFDDPEHPLVQVDPESLFEAAGPSVHTDAAGYVTLPADADPVFVWARIDDRFGSTRVKRERNAAGVLESEQEIQVTIDRGVHLDIQVVDANERPVAGVPVSIRDNGKTPFSMPVWTGITGPGGVARARHLERALARLEQPSTLVAGFEFPTRTASTLPVDIACIPKAPLRLILPACGSVELRTRDALGTPLFPSNVELSVSKPDMESFVVSVSRGSECKPAEVQPGRALFPFVETGLELTARLTIDMKALRHSGRGPITAGERVTFDIDVGMQRPQLTGRLVDPDGVPLAETACQSMIAGGNVSMQTSVQTDALGRFTLTVSCDAEQRFNGTLAFQQIKGRPSEESGMIELDRVLHSGTNEVGDVTVRSPRVLATIRVVDEAEVVIQGAWIGVEVERPRDGVLAWVHSWDLRPSRNRVDDTLEVKGVAPARRLRIRAYADDYMQLEPCVIEPDVPNARVVMVKSCEVGGRILVDDDVDAKLIRVYLRGLDDASGAVESSLYNERTQAQADGTFRLKPVRARLVDLFVTLPDSKEPLAVLRDLDLRAGGRAHDPRLNEIDLRGRKMGTDR